MQYGFCKLSVIPVRKKPADTSEMVTQLLFGETLTVLEETEKWSKIKCTWDGYEGWIDQKQYTEIDETTYQALQDNVSYSLEIAQPALTSDLFLPLLMGSSLPNYDGMSFSIQKDRYTFSGQTITPEQLQPTSELILKLARRYLHTPYLWGGRSPFGIDCSGFTQIVFKMAGIKIKRDASQQVRQGKLVGFLPEIQAGDLAFFENDKGRVIHVGIVLPENKIIHASGKVRIDTLDRYGILNQETQQYSHKLRVIKRYL